MTLNLSLVTDEFALCVTDRRLSLPRGSIVSERSNKLTVFQCRNAHGFITYCGIGRDSSGHSPSDWLIGNPILPTLHLDDFLQTIKNIGDVRLKPLSAKGHDTRHTFVIGGFVESRPFLVLISNFESIMDEDARNVADAELSISYCVASQGQQKPVIVLAIGDIPKSRKSRITKLGGLAKDSAQPQTLLAQMTKLIRDVSYARNRAGNVGTSVNTVVVPSYGPVDLGGSIVGGTTLIEPPNMISPSAMYRDAYIDISGTDAGSRYSPRLGKALIKETRCVECLTPVPEGYRQCGKCDAPVAV